MITRKYTKGRFCRPPSPFLCIGPPTVKEPLISGSLAVGPGYILGPIVWFLRNLLCSQLGLFVEFNPEDMLLGVEETEDDGDLEAELLALTGEAGTTGRKPVSKGKGELSVLGWTWCWDHMGSSRWWRGSSHSCEDVATSPGPSDTHVPSAALSSCPAHLCDGARTPFPGCPSS